MTGGQDVTGLLEVPGLTRALEAEGVKKIVVCAEDPRHYGRRARWARGTEVLGRDRLPEVQERLRDVPGVTVIIYDQRCAARRAGCASAASSSSRRVGCSSTRRSARGAATAAVKSNCLSVLPLETEFGDKRQIHDASCNRDYTCLEGDCPSFVTIKPANGKRRAGPSQPPRRPSGTGPSAPGCRPARCRCRSGRRPADGTTSTSPGSAAPGW